MRDFRIMDTFSPEFSQYWLADQRTGPDAALAGHRDEDAPSPSQQQALDALADRVSAARSVM